MLTDVISQSANAMAAYEQALDATSSDIANMNVTGYKGLDVSFQAIFERLVRQGMAPRNNLGGIDPMQSGGGVGVSSMSVNYAQGAFVQGAGLDLAVNGQGLFIVSANSGNSYLYTRAGNFQVDASGNLTSNSMQVYGLDTSGNTVAITGLPSGNNTAYRWLDDGTLQYSPDGGTTYVNTGYQIALTYFANPHALAQAQGTSFAETTASGSPNAAQLPGGAVGTVRPGYIEQSNVDYLTETLNATEIQNAINTQLTMTQMAKSIFDNFLNKIS